MLSISDSIQRAQVDNERRLSAQITVPEQKLGPYVERLRPFVDWCKAKGVRPCPAQSTTLLAYLRDQKAADPAFTLQFLAAVQLLHEKYRQPDPVDDAIKSEVWRMISEAVTDPTDPLRSWSKEEKLLFPSMPPAVQKVLERIDIQRTKEIRKLQHEVAALADIKTLRRLNHELELAQSRATTKDESNA